MSEIKLGKIAIIGGTGKAGRSLVNQIVKKEYPLRILVRNPEKLKISGKQIEVIKGDARSIESIQTLLEGCDAVLSTLGQPNGEAPVFSTATSNILSTMKEKGIKRYVLVTGIGVNVPGDKKGLKGKLTSKMMKWMSPAIMSDKQKEYEILTKSDREWTLVRLPLIVEGPSIGDVKVNLEHSLGTKISSMDLADFLIKQIADTKNVRKAPFISN